MMGMDQPNTHEQEEQKLVRLLQANPEMMEPIRALLSMLEDEKSLGGKADDIEEQIMGQLRLLGRGSLQGWAQRANALAQQQAKGHAHVKNKLWWLSLFGRIEVEETRLRHSRGKVQRPFVQQAGVRNTGTSKALKRAMVDFGADGSFGKAAWKIHEHYGLEVSQGRVARECLRTAHALPREPRVARTLAPSGPDAIVAEADGTMIPLVQIDAQAAGDRRKQRTTHWKEARLVVAQAQGSTAKTYAAGFDSPEQAGARWTQVVRQAGCAPQTWVHGVGDGAEWISAQFTQHFAGRGKYLLDMYHVCEYLGECAPAGQSKSEYLESTKEALKQNKAAEVLEELRARLETPDKPEDEAPVRRAYRYMDNRREQLDYQGALEKKLPIGSGLIESGHRHVLQARLKQPGMWWREDNAHAMAQLRVCRANGLWSELWRN
jgi:hypothetical protein